MDVRLRKEDKREEGEIIRDFLHSADKPRQSNSPSRYGTLGHIGKRSNVGRLLEQ